MFRSPLPRSYVFIMLVSCLSLLFILPAFAKDEQVRTILFLPSISGGEPQVHAADAIPNNLDLTVDAVAEIMSITAGGINGTTQLYVVPENGDGKSGCNLTGSTTLVVSVSSSNTGVATVSPTPVTFTSCGDTRTLTITPIGAGTADITLGLISNSTAGTFHFDTAKFTVNVAPAPPTNTPPQISIVGVTGGSSYNKGSVPAATCEVTDTEDGPSSFPATLSLITGPYASDGIGSQDASCSYTDAGGLTAQSSVTYGIVDPSAPVITYVLAPTSPDGLNDWYVNDVTLTWNVSEPQSPNSVQKTGCVNQNIVADQDETPYTCSASSAGGLAGPVEVTIKRDATKPTISGSTSPVANSNGWNNSDVTVSFTCDDNLSGVASCEPNQTLSGEGAGQSASGTAIDNAGNSASDTVSNINIDKTGPSLSGAPKDPANGNGGWYKSDVTIVWTCSDTISGIDGACPDDSLISTEGTGLTANASVSDLAGNSTNATSAPVVKIDKTAPSVSLVNGPANGGSYYFGSVPDAPTCSASDGTSGLAAPCSVSGYSAAVGSHTVTASATDNAGNSSSVSASYTVDAWTLKGFYQPVDMNGVYNTVKGGSTVPLKFEIFAGATELRSTSNVKSLTSKQITCNGTALTDDIETTATGGTTLRYDTTADQFVYNWKLPTGAGACYQVTMTTQDGSALVAYFKLK